MDYLKFKNINKYLRSIRKNSDIILIKVDSFNKNNCVVVLDKQKATYPLNYIVNGVISGLFCITNPSIFSNLDFSNFNGLEQKQTIRLEYLKKRHSKSFYYEKDYINLNCFSNKAIINPSIKELNNDNNDFGDGLYCCFENDVKKLKNVDGKYITKFRLKTSDLKVLDLRDYSYLNWLALFLYNKYSLYKDCIESDLFIKKYFLNYLDYDCIYGYVSDELLSSLIYRFVNKEIDDRTISYILNNDCLDYNFVLISSKALDNLEFLGYTKNKYERVNNNYSVGRTASCKYIYDYLKEVI